MSDHVVRQARVSAFPIKDLRDFRDYLSCDS